MDTDSEPVPTPFTYPPTAKERARIRHLVKKIPPSQITAFIIDGSLPIYLDNCDESFVNELICHLEWSKDKYWERRAIAAWLLGHCVVTASQRERMLPCLRRILDGYSRTKNALRGERLRTAFFRAIAVGYPILLTVFIYLTTIANSSDGIFPDPILFSFILALPCSLVAVILLLPITYSMTVTDANFANIESRVYAVRAIHRQNALEALPELLEAACDKSPEVLKKCRLALIDFLPQINEENRDSMPLNSEELLGKILEDVPDLALGSAVLDYLEKFGQGRNCAAVEFYLTCLTHKASAPTFNEVYAKGQRVFVVLQERRGRILDGEHLLRHSIAPNAQPDELLRPAADLEPTPSEQLLRASDSSL